MSFLTNIKYQYNLKLLNDCISSNNYEDFFINIEKNSKNKQLYIKLLFNLGIDVIKQADEDFFSSKLIWLNSFLDEDLEYLSNFLNFYQFNHNNNHRIGFYEEEVLGVLKDLQQINEINFNDFINYSYLYQYLILRNSKLDKFLKNTLPFFSTPNQLNFSHINLTRCYFYIMDHPYQIYQKLKNELSGDQNLARNKFLNLDDQSFQKKINDVDLEISKKGWHTHMQSWTSSNIINVHKGKVILKKDLHSNTFETLSSVILHLIQSGSSFELDYDLINDFIKNNPTTHTPLELEISHKEKKFIDQYVGDLISLYNFDN